ncbi:MAG: hypothetical protein WD995_07245 [Gemmatimonadota bacterium]
MRVIDWLLGVALPRFSAFAFFALLALPLALAAQDPADRFGVWRMQSDAPPPSSNIMTYEPHGDGGMRITVESTNARGQDSKWGYVTLFDGEFRPVDGQEGSDTAVEFVDDRTTRITNRRNGRVTQVIINTLSEDGNVIENEYVRLDADGKITGVGHATYVRVR